VSQENADLRNTNSAATVSVIAMSAYLPCLRGAVALSDHSIKAACHTTKYLIGRLLAGKLISIPTRPNASARTIAPHDAPSLSFRDASIVARIVAVGAFYQTGRKPMSLTL